MAETARIMTKDYDGPGRRREDELLGVRLDALHSDIGEIKSAMRDLTNAITKLALVEERQAHANAAIDRAFASVTKVDTRVTNVELRVIELEKSIPTFDRTAMWVDRGIWSAVGLLAMYVAKSSGLL